MTNLPVDPEATPHFTRFPLKIYHVSIEVHTFYIQICYAARIKFACALTAIENWFFI
jgi:hypothetical protein